MRQRLDVADQVLVLLSLVPYLTENGPTPVIELSERFTVDPKLMRKLLHFLGTAGVPGETQTYQHEDLFDIDWDALEHRDVAHLITPVAVDDTPRFAPAETAALLAGLHTLTTMLGPEDARLAEQTAQKLAGAFEVTETSVSVAAEPHDPRLVPTLDAIERRRMVSFTYRDARGVESTRRADPLRLTQGPDTWYLRAFCHDRSGERTFRLDRITDFTVLEDPIEASHHRTGEPMDGGAHSSVEPSSADAPADELTRLVLRMPEWVLPRISGFEPVLWDFASDTASSVPTLSPGWVRVAVQVRYLAASVHLLQQASGEIIIEAPPTAVATVRAWAEEALAQYDDRTA